MTEKQIKAFKAKSLKEKIALSQKKAKILVEIDNYTDVIKQGTQFQTYHEYRLKELKVKLKELEDED
jgi:hypothetical protein